MHFFMAWKTEKNKIHFSEHVHEPAIIFFLCMCKCYILLVTVVYCAYNVRQLALQLPCLLPVCSNLFHILHGDFWYDIFPF